MPRAHSSILDKLVSPLIVLPGNHDGNMEAFYQDFPRPEPVMQIGDVRFLPFVDAEAPGYNATRRHQDLESFPGGRQDFKGMIVALQHVCLHPPGRAIYPTITRTLKRPSGLCDTQVLRFHSADIITMAQNLLLMLQCL